MNSLNPTAVATLADIEAFEACSPDLSLSLCSTYELLARGAAIAPDMPALSFFVRTEDHARPVVWSHREWLARITQTANMLRRLGVQRGDVVAYILPNLPETHWTIWGAETAGIAFAINALLEPATMRELLVAANARWLVTQAPTAGDPLWDKVSRCATEVASLRGVITVDALRHLPTAAAMAPQPLPHRVGQLSVYDFGKLVAASPDEDLEFDAPQVDDVASYFCTGGTTGRPKIAVRTHATETANAIQLAAVLGEGCMVPGRTMFCGLPLFHVNAQIGTGLAPWSRGGHVLLGTAQGFRAPGLIPQFWDIAARHRLVTLSGVPTIYASLLQVPRAGQDLSALRYALCGAAPMPVELFRRFETEIGVRILEGYGLTEAGCVSTLNPPDAPTRFGSIGLRMPWQEVRALALDDEGRYLRDAEVGEVGILAVRGPNLFAGYLEAEHNKGLWIERPGADRTPRRWLNTGDLGRVDGDGFCWLAGRKKELIIRGGHNVDPKTIEEPLHRHPAVALAAAVGYPDAHAGEVPIVYVQLRPGAQATSDELMAHAQRAIGERAAWPKRIEIVEALPLTAVGKIFKPALTLRAIESAARAEAVAAGATLDVLEAASDARVGAVLRWRAHDNADALRARLARHTFRTEELAAPANGG